MTQPPHKGKVVPLRRWRVYADSSVFGGVFDEEFAGPSQLFFEQVVAGRFHLVVSPLLDQELRLAPDRVWQHYERLSFMSEMASVSDEVVALHAAYLRERIVAPKWATDALHVALASVQRCAILVSWNFKHIVHFRKIAAYNAVNVGEGYSSLSIHTPQEVVDYEKGL